MVITSWRPPRLETDRLILRPIDENDAASIFAYAASANLTRFTLWDAHRSLDDTLTFVREYTFANYLEQVPDPFGICLKDDVSQVVGTIGCQWASRPNRTMELGYVLAEWLWGRGLTVEASRAVINFVFAEFPVERIQARCMSPNENSARVMQKLGMTFEGVLRRSLFHRGIMWDMHLYSVLREEWFKS
jgi:ribosomal-protein-alanine N-acetyltransferase